MRFDGKTALDALHERRNERRDREEHDADDGVESYAAAHGRQAHERKVDERARRALFEEQERDRRDGGATQRQGGGHAVQPEQQAQRGEPEGSGPEPVDVRAVPGHALVEEDDHHRGRDRADRQVHVEGPAPRQRLREQPADRRAHHGGGDPHRAEEGLHARASAQREEIADDRQANGQQRARSEALHRPEDDELVHVA